MTTLAPPPPAVPAPAPADRPVEPARRAVTVTARLLPPDIVAGRRLRALQKKIVYGLVLLVLVLALGYVWAWLQTGSANDDLAAEQQRGTHSQQQLTRYTPLLAIKSQVTSTVDTLDGVMAGDVQWRTLLSAVRAAAPKGVVITGITGAVTDPTQPPAGASAGPTGLQVLNQTGQLDIGTLGITGTASSKDAVAAYVDALGKVKGVAAPLPATVTTTSGALTFDLQALITKSALSARYALPAANGGN